MNSVSKLSSAEAVEGLLSLVNAAEPIYDVTFGSGTFWKGSSRQVIGSDIAENRTPGRVLDFCNLPFKSDSLPTVVFDPPFHPDVNSAEEHRFKTMGANDAEMKELFLRGVAECWRVTQNHLLVKCQGFIHNHKPQWMPLWAISVCGEPFEWLVVWRDGKRTSGRWVSNKSLRRNHADYLLFSKKGNHR